MINKKTMSQTDTKLCNKITRCKNNVFFDTKETQDNFWKEFLEQGKDAQAFILCLGITGNTEEGHCIEVVNHLGKGKLKFKEYLFDKMRSVGASDPVYYVKDDNYQYEDTNQKWNFWLIKDEECLVAVKKWLITRSL
jgi:hypothetical protein